MLDNIFVQKKIDLLSESIGKLERLLTNDVEEIKNDELKLPALERHFQKTVDTMIDINTHIIREGNFGTVDDLQSTFKMLGDVKVLHKDFADKISPIVGVRNMLVHRYEKLDKDLFLSNLKRNFSDLKTYLIQIHDYLEKEKIVERKSHLKKAT